MGGASWGQAHPSVPKPERGHPATRVGLMLSAGAPDSLFLSSENHLEHTVPHLVTVCARAQLCLEPPFLGPSCSYLGPCRLLPESYPSSALLCPHSVSMGISAASFQTSYLGCFQFLASLLGTGSLWWTCLSEKMGLTLGSWLCAGIWPKGRKQGQFCAWVGQSKVAVHLPKPVWRKREDLAQREA